MLAGAGVTVGTASATTTRRALAADSPRTILIGQAA